MENLRKMRKKKDLTQVEMAKVLNVSRATYSRYELGIRNPDYDTLIRISKFFNVSTDYLLGLIEVPFTSEEVRFMEKIQHESDPEKLSEEFDVYFGDQKVTGNELLEILKTMKKLDQEVHGDFFRNKK